MSEDNGAIAQLGEHLLCKQGVIGSIPISSTIFLRSRMSGPSGLCSARAPNGRRRAVARVGCLAVGLSWSKRFQAEGLARPTGRRRSCGAPAQARPSQMAGAAVSEKDLILKKKVCTALQCCSAYIVKRRLCLKAVPSWRVYTLAGAVMSDDLSLLFVCWCFDGSL